MTEEREVREPVSGSQEQMWSNEALRGTDTVYTMAEVLRVSTPLDASRLQQALDALQHRHDVLRTVFAADDGRPYRIVRPSVDVTAKSFSLDPDGDHERDFRTILDDELSQPFDLNRGPLWRCVLGSAGEVSYLAVIMHHIVADGWSLEVLVHELGALYEGVELPAVLTRYQDFVAAERAWLASPDADEARLHWRHELTDAPHRSTLPGPGLRASHVGRQLTLRLPSTVPKDVAALAARHGATPYIFYLTAHALLLARHSGARDLVIGIPGANRWWDEFADTVGLLLNPLPLRLRFPAEVTVPGALALVRDAMLEALQYQRLPFSAIVREAEISRDSENTPLFQTIVAARTVRADSTLFAGGRAEWLHSYTGTAKYDLTVTFPDAPDDDTVVLEYDLGRFDPPYLEMVADGYRSLVLELLGSADDAPIAVCPQLSAASRAAHTVHGRFSAVARELPQQPAVIQGANTLTFAELDLHSERMARTLRATGVTRGDIVALRLPPGPDFITAALAVLRAGAAYLPLDDRWPDDRVRQVLADSAAVLRLDVGDTALQPRVTTLTPAAPEASGQPLPDGRTGSDPGGGDLAYVMYTSGSTGKPKGVMVEHGSILALASPGQRFALRRGDRTAHHSNLAFDAATFELWCTLLGGGTVVVAPSRDLGPEAYRELINSVTAIFITTGLFTELMRDPGCRRALYRTRLLLVGGDVLNPSVLAPLDRPGQLRLHCYGPTETTTFATVGSLDERTDRGTVPIGRAVEGARCLVLDERRAPVTEGGEGELHIGGAGVALGYLNRPGLTAQRFAPDDTGQRQYATGDRVRLLPDGALDFVGRLDHQVKIRGFRVELGEVEAVMAEHPAVETARAVLMGDSSALRRLVLVIRPHIGARPHTLAEEAREFLSTRLPAFMQPHEVFVVDHIPLTPNGKVDLGRLAAEGRQADGVPRATAEVALDPATGTATVDGVERARVATLWRGALGASADGGRDFIDAGGDSLTALRLLVAVKAEFGVEITPGELFAHPGPTQFAELVLERARSTTAVDSPPALRPEKRPAAIPLSFAQFRLWFLQRLEGVTAAYNMPLALRLSGPLDETALHQALADVVTRHESLRTVFRTTEGTPRQVILSGAEGRPRLDVMDTTPRSLAAALATAASRPFDLTVDLPVRAELFRVGEGERVLLLLFHHIAIDGWSLAPLTHDLATAYTERSHGRRPTWTPLPVQYADYTLWQRRELGDQGDQGSVIGRQLAFWVDQLGSLPIELPLPTDRPRPARPMHRGASVAFTVAPGLHTELLALAKEHGATLFMVVHTAVVAVLSRLGAGEDITVGTPIAGREEEALRDLVGFFANTLVLRTDASGDPSFTELLSRVRTTDLAAYAHGDIPFDHLVEALNPPRAPNRHPLFQVMLAFQSGLAEVPDLEGLTVTRVPLSTGSPKFDLGFYLSERFTDARDPAGIECTLDFDDGLFAHRTAERIAGLLHRTLAHVVRDPAVSLSRLELVDAQESRDARARLAERNDTSRPGASATLVEAFEESVATCPHADAVQQGPTAITYAELDAQANRMARLLVDRGVGPGALVALFLPRSADAITAMLAVLKAGGAYLPLDAGHPDARTHRILADAAPALLLTHTALRATTPTTGPAVEVLALDAHDTRTTIARYAPHPLTDEERRTPLTPDHAAYVIYTSGSTGRPKGVVVPHRALANYATRSARAYRGLGGRTLLHSSLSFDLGLTTLYGTLLAGGCLLVADLDEQLAHGPELTFVKATPSHLPLLESMALSCSPDVQLMLGGEPLRSEQLRIWRERHPGSEIINHYGPTESTVGCLDHRIPADAEPRSGPVPLGLPMDNMRVYVLDAALRPVPDGMTGELYVAGHGLAQGYADAPAATAGRFVADPFDGPGGRMYRTGDLARWTTEGLLEFRGRADTQVKLRGHRVEPAEIETVLVTHPEVAAAAVVVREDHPGQQRLIAYVVSTPGHQVDAPRIRRWSETLLPGYMVPSQVVEVPELPRTANGKLDPRALPDPPPLTTVDRPPATEREHELCRLFSEVLGVPEVGVADNFFDLGGNSVLSVRLVQRVRAVLGIDLPLHTLFERQTVTDLAALLEDDGLDRQVGVDLAAEAVLPPDIAVASIPPTAVAAADEPRGVLLTGATGFLGAFLLRELLDRTRAVVVCPVRAEDRDAAQARLRASLRRYLLTDEVDNSADDLWSRVVAVPADLRQPLLGMSPEDLELCTSGVDVIVHNAAQVHAAASYRQLAAANVHGTVEVLRLALRGRIKPVHHVSTLTTVVGTTGPRGPIPEDHRVAADAVPMNGYAQTKWVAEEMVRLARGRGLPTSVYRPGRVSGHTRTGAGSTDDAFWQQTAACLELGAAPQSDGSGAWGTEAALVPVDYVAAALVHLMRHPHPDVHSYHLTASRSVTLSAVMDRARALGYQIRSLPYEEWTALLLRHGRGAYGQPSAAVAQTATLVSMHRRRWGGGGPAPAFDQTHTLRGLAGSGIGCDGVGTQTIDRYLEYFLACGFFPARTE